jgi:hypothetical protein
MWDKTGDDESVVGMTTRVSIPLHVGFACGGTT